MTIQQMRARLAAAQTELKGLLDLGEALSAEQQTQMTALCAEVEKLQADLTAAVAAQNRANGLFATGTAPAAATPLGGGTDLPPPAVPGQLQDPSRAQASALPATALRSRPTNFRERDGRSAQLQAYEAGQWLLATCRGSARSKKYCEEHGIPLAWMNPDGQVQLAHSEIVNSAGGFLVFPEFESTLIDLREQYGVVRPLFKNHSMSSDSLTIPRRTGGLTAYWVGDSVAITESQKSWDNVSLVAKKSGVLAKYSSELNEDAVIDMANDLAGEIAYAFAALEDDCGINGDGSSTYSGIVGVLNALLNLSATRANIAGLHVGAGNLWSELTLSDFNLVAAKLPVYAQTPRSTWLMSQAFWSAVPERLMLAAGGITDAMIAAGATKRLLGYPVKIAQKMPRVEGNDQVCALLGDFSLGAKFGDRRMTTIATSEHAGFAADELQIRGTQRFDINVHDVGNAHATAASRQAGPIVGLLTAAS